MTLAKCDVVVVSDFPHKLLRRKKPDFFQKVGFLFLLLKSIYPYLITIVGFRIAQPNLRFICYLTIDPKSANTLA
jgi:hypothetical protein